MLLSGFVKNLLLRNPLHFSAVMPCTQMVPTVFTVPWDLSGTGEITHKPVHPVHDFHHLDSVKFEYGIGKNFADFTPPDFHPVKTGLFRADLKNKRVWTPNTCTKCTGVPVGTLVRTVHVFSASSTFLPSGPLQHLDPQKPSGIPPTADMDFVGVFQIVKALVLLQVTRAY